MLLTTLTHFVDETLLVQLAQEGLVTIGSEIDPPRYWNDFYWVNDTQVTAAGFAKVERHLADAGRFICGDASVHAPMLMLYRTFYLLREEKPLEDLLLDNRALQTYPPLPASITTAGPRPETP